MLTIIFHQVPYWVWFLLPALVIIGLVQALPRRRTLKSAILIPLVMVLLSLYGVLAVFSHQAMPVLAWGMGISAGVALCQVWKLWGGIVWLASDRRLIMPGSWLPLAVIMCLFSIKFVVGVTIGMQPGMTMNPGFASLVGLSYGAFSGLFLGRGIAVLKAAKALQVGADRSKAQ